MVDWEALSLQNAFAYCCRYHYSAALPEQSPMIAALTVVSVLWFITVGFAAGCWCMSRTVKYRMGKKIEAGMQKVLDARAFIGPGSVTVMDTIHWEHEGHKWKLTLEQFPREEA